MKRVRVELFSKKKYPLDGIEFYLGEACSVSRQLTKSHTKAFSVRRSSDNSVLDIGFRLDGNLNINQLLDFVGSGSGFVQKLYGCNGSILLNDSTAKEPRIVNSGVLDVVNNRPTMIFDGSNDVLWCANNANIDILNQPLYIGLVNVIDTATTDSTILSKNTDSSATNQYMLKFESSKITTYLEGTGNNVGGANNSITKDILYLNSFNWINNTMSIYVNGNTSGSPTSYNGNLTSRNFLTIGCRQSTSSTQTSFTKGKISEFYILKGNPKKSDFETRTKKYYGIV